MNISNTQTADLNPTPAVVVFGATGGIGSELCRRLRSRDWNVLAAGRDAKKLEALQGEFGVETFAFDGINPASYLAAMNLALECFGRLTGVVNCIGSLLLKPAHLTSVDEWSAVIHANLTSAFCAVNASGQLLTTGGGSLVLVSSSAARVGIANHEAIAAAKAGVMGLTLSAAATYAPRGLRVNAVAPGLVRTPLTARVTGNETSLKVSTAMHAMGRIGEPSDVASAIEWLLDPAQSWVTGQVIGVDGGLGSVMSRRTG
jgi:NAD(P)-dependent dehydrogenase (short-subunit alcohol dehydrogenase family)